MKKFEIFPLKKFIGLVFGACILVPAMATADSFYIEGRIGSQFPMEIDTKSVTSDGVAITHDRTYKPTSALSGSLAIGGNVTPNIRLEGDVTYLKITDAQIKGDSFGADFSYEDATGSISKTRLLFNVLYDFNGVADWVTPFLGVGLGWTWYDLDNVGATNSDSDYQASGSDSHFTWALHAGADFPITQRFLFTTRYTLSNRNELNIHTNDPDNGGRIDTLDTEIENGLGHALSAGFKFKF